MHHNPERAQAIAALGLPPEGTDPATHYAATTGELVRWAREKPQIPTVMIIVADGSIADILIARHDVTVQVVDTDLRTADNAVHIAEFDATHNTTSYRVVDLDELRKQYGGARE